MNFSKILSVAFLTVVLTSCSSNKLTVEDVEQEVKDPVDENNTDCKLGKVYIEKEGLLRVDIINTDPSNNWSTENTLTGFEGTGYLVYTGPDSFSNPGNDVLNFPIKITQPGVYQFVLVTLRALFHSGRLFLEHAHMPANLTFKFVIGGG